MAWLLFLARIIAAGALLLAGAMKLGIFGGGQQMTQAPLVFALSLQSFKLVPNALVPMISYFVPWCEVIAGGALLLGIWPRASAAIVSGLLFVFTVALASILIRGLNVDCGCFGGLFGETKVTWTSILRNAVLTACAVAVAIRGGGAFALRPDDERNDYPSSA
ncbi:MAG: MauE/DoxX family redox-associated membrane protein [Candidatus Sumerlaeota bacterium]